MGVSAIYIWGIFGAIILLGSVHADFFQDENADDVIYAANDDAKVGETQCFGTLGCLNWTQDFFNTQHRPKNKKIQTRDQVGTSFLLYTRKNRDTPQTLKADDVNTIKRSNFIKTAPTAFVTHGLKGSCDKSGFMKRTKNEFLTLAEYNIVLVDWRDGCNSIMDYDQATSNTRVVGAEIAFLISKFKEVHGYSSQKVYLIGHSLGAQASGYAGKRLQTNYNLKLGRLTALDPAGPSFTQMPTTVKVYKTDADFVDVIHSDTRGKMISLGLPEAVGHIDFYPEGGNVQPGCTAYYDESESIEVEAALGGSVSCSHSRAHQLFENSINAKGAVPVAYRCRDWETFKNGDCGSCGSDISDCAMVGYRARDTYKATSKTDSFYITTGASEPYWIYLYQVTVEISRQSTRQSGKLKLKLKESDKKFLQLTIPTSTLEPGSKYRALATTQFAGLQIREIEFTWGGLFSYADPFTWPWLKAAAPTELKVEKISLLPMTVIELNSQPRGTKNYCTPKPVPKSTTIKFTSCR